MSQLKLRVPDLYDECLTECRLDYIDCLGQCESSYCHSECLAIFSGCDVSCPCGLACELGCVDCDHPICEKICENAQEENEEYKACLQKAQQNFVRAKNCKNFFTLFSERLYVGVPT